MQFHKDELLESILPRCSSEIWISGYRLIMTAKTSFLKALTAACKNSPGLQVKVLAVAPWSETFQLVYGQEDVTDNYFKVFYTLCHCRREYGTHLEIRLTNKPIFNDTYKVDDRFVTGPYLHCISKNQTKITAKDFFSLDINDPRKELFTLVSKDYLAVWASAGKVLDCDRFLDSFPEKKNRLSAASREEKLDQLKKWCLPRNPEME